MNLLGIYIFMDILLLLLKYNMESKFPIDIKYYGNYIPWFSN